ncbi:MAG TPA: hypothetical protein VIR77_03320 [Pontiella sp.]
MMSNSSRADDHKRGAALLVVLGVLIILSLIVGSFAFEVQLESILISHKRKKFRAEMTARSGIEYARALLDQQQQTTQTEVEDAVDDEDNFKQTALYIKRGLPAKTQIEIEEGIKFKIDFTSAESGRNANLLTREQWMDIFEMANVPSTDWDAMIDCLQDWTDENDLHGLNGAESDDEFYRDQGYEVKNGPLDSVEELLLIKNWGPEILYGKNADEDGDQIFGIAKMLTVWGSGKVNLNSASDDVLLSYSEYEEWELASVFEARKGLDGEENTSDDGIRSLNDIGADESKFKLQSEFVKVTSIGDVFGIEYRIEAIFLQKSKNSVVVYWNEGPVTKNN